MRPSRASTGRALELVSLALLGNLVLFGCGGADQNAQTATDVTGHAGDRPHVLLLMADDLGWGDVGYYGSEIRTPTLDELAQRGVRLDRFYSMPSCTPARAALMTGRFPLRFGMQIGIVWKDSDFGLPPAERTLAEALGAHGYQTAIVGKWHLGHHVPEMKPLGQGFESHYGSYLASGGYFNRRRKREVDWYRDDELIDEELGYTTNMIASEAVRLIHERDQARPLFLFVSFTAPHLPLEAPKKYLSRTKHIADPDRATYAAMVECMDFGISRILSALSEEGLTENTLVVFLSDNGAAEYEAGSNAPLRGGKQTLYEGGVRVPALAVWPGTLPAGEVVDELVHVTDLYPTILKVAGAPLAQERELDGVDVWPVLAEASPSPHEELLVNYYPPNTGALIRGEWKYYVDQEKKANPPQLFNLALDPGEERDVSAEHPEVLEDLRARLELYAAHAMEPLARGSRE